MNQTFELRGKDCVATTSNWIVKPGEGQNPFEVYILPMNNLILNKKVGQIEIILPEVTNEPSVGVITVYLEDPVWDIVRKMSKFAISVLIIPLGIWFYQKIFEKKETSLDP